MKTETHDNFVNEAVRTAESGHPDLHGYFDDFLNRVEIAAIAEHDPWLPYPENKPEIGIYIVSRAGADMLLLYWNGYNISHKQWKRLNVIAFRPLPAPYVKGGAK